MRKLICIISIFSFSFSFCEGQSWLWGIQGNGDGEEEGDHSIVVSTNGNINFVGVFISPISFGGVTLSASGINIAWGKFNSLGNAYWLNQSTKGRSSMEYAYSIAIDRTNNTYITGFFDDSLSFGTTTLKCPTGSSVRDVFLVKCDTGGNVVWAKAATIPSNFSYARGSALVVDSKASIYLAGTYIDTVVFQNDTLKTIAYGRNAYLVKYDSNGNVIWANGPTSISINGESYGYSVAIDGFGNSYITGAFNDSIRFGTYNLYSQSGSYLTKYDPNGNVLWAKQSETINGSASGSSVAIDYLGNIYCTGYFYDSISFGAFHLNTLGTNAVFLTKYDSMGNVLWAEQGVDLHNSEWSGCSVVADTLKQGGCYLLTRNAGGASPYKLKFNSDTITYSTAFSTVDVLLKIDTSGNVRCGVAFSDGNEDDGDGLGVDPGGKYVCIFGDSYGAITFGNDTFSDVNEDIPFIAQWQPCSNIETYIPEPHQSELPPTLFPNPNNGQFTIQSSVENGQSSVEIYNMLGEKVFTETLRSTQGDNTINLSGQPNGIYLYRVLQEDGSLMGEGKVVIEK